MITYSNNNIPINKFYNRYSDTIPLLEQLSSNDSLNKILH